MSSLLRRIRLRILRNISDPDAYREARAELRKSPHWNKPLNQRPRKSPRIPHALRRSKRSQQWLEARAAKRRAKA